jgi:ferredoxin
MAKRIVRVWVDEPSCASHEACKIVPEVFADGPNYFPIVPADAPRNFGSKRAEVIEAVMSCPTASLFLEFEDGRVVSSADYNREVGLQGWLNY